MDLLAYIDHESFYCSRWPAGMFFVVREAYLVSRKKDKVHFILVLRFTLASLSRRSGLHGIRFTVH